MPCGSSTWRLYMWYRIQVPVLLTYIYIYIYIYIENNAKTKLITLHLVFKPWDEHNNCIFARSFFSFFLVTFQFFKGNGVLQTISCFSSYRTRRLLSQQGKIFKIQPYSYSDELMDTPGLTWTLYVYSVVSCMSCPQV